MPLFTVLVPLRTVYVLKQTLKNKKSSVFGKIESKEEKEITPLSAGNNEMISLKKSLRKTSV